MHNREPAVSVITIVKNDVKLLPRAVDSVLGQSFRDFEYIVVNDGSTDNTRAIIDDYAEKDRRVKPIHLPQNMGRAMARNTGLDAARGRYIFFLDADDYLPENALMDLYEVAEEDNVDIVFGGIKAFDQKTQNWRDHHYTDDFCKYEAHCVRLDEYLELAANHTIVGRLYRSIFLERHNIRFSNSRKNGEDVVFAFYTAFHAGSMTVIPYTKVYYYGLGNFLGAANKSKLFDARDNIIETLVFAKERGSETLIRRLQVKAAIYAGNLGRARVVLGMGDELKMYLPSLLPLVEGLDDEVSMTLPPYYQKFAEYLRAGEYEKAIFLFSQKGKFEASQRGKAEESRGLQYKIEKTNQLNRELCQELDKLYNSLSWRITRPVRLVRRIVGGK